MFIIQDNVPMPAKVSTRVHKYPFAKMEVGQSFVIPAINAPKTGVSAVKSASTGYRRTKGAMDKKFIVTELENGDIGVWRSA
jgi:hypothetical protein